MKRLFFMLQLIGVGFCLIGNAYAYKLPYPAGNTYNVTQGNFGKLSHSHNTYPKAIYAFDFDFQDGDTVVAAASGKVHLIKMDSHEGGCDNAYANKANYIVIDHGNGQASLYMHLKANSSGSLKVGDEVKAGQTIAKTGKSGYGCDGYNRFGYHLHFQVQELCSSWWCQSVQVNFDDVSGDGVPKQGESYTSQNYQPSSLGSSGSSDLTIRDLWRKNGTIYAGERNGFDAQFKLQNNSSQTVTVDTVAMSIHDSSNRFLNDMKLSHNVHISAGNYYQMPFTAVNSPATPGQYKVVAKVYQNQQWQELDSTDFTVVKAKVTTPTLSSVELVVPTTLNENSCTNLSVVGKFSDGSSKTLSPYIWREYSSSTTINGSGRLCASQVTQDERVKVKAYVNYNGQYMSSYQYLTVKNSGSSTPTSTPVVTLKSVELIVPTTLNENSCTNLSVVGKLSNGSSKTLSPYKWREYGSSTTISSSGRLCASSVTQDESVKVKGYVTYNGQKFYPYKYLTVKNNGSSYTPTPTPTPPQGNRVKTPSRIDIYGCRTISEGRSCSYRARVYYTDGSSTEPSNNVSWSENSQYAYFSGSRLTARYVSGNQYVNIRVSYTENGRTITKTGRITIRDIF